MGTIGEKYMELEFEEDATEEEILSELFRYSKIGVLAMTTINGHEVWNSFDDLACKIHAAFYNLDDSEVLKLKELEKSFDCNSKLLANAIRIKFDVSYKYYYGIIKRFVDPEKTERFDDTMVYYYDLQDYKKAVKIAAEMVICLNTENDLETLKAFNKFFDRFDFKNHSYLTDAMDIIKNFVVGGEKIDEIMSTDIVSESSKRYEEKLNVLTKRKNAILEKNKK